MSREDQDLEAWKCKRCQAWMDRHKLLEQFSDVEGIKVAPRYGEFEVRLHSKGTISNSTALAVTKAICDAWKMDMHPRVRELKELTDSPEHIELAKHLYCLQHDERFAMYPIPDFDIYLGGLERITRLVARAFAECNSGRDRLLDLSSLKEIPDDVAKEFEAFRFETLDLSGLEELTPFAAEKLCSAKVDALILDGLKSLSLETAIVIAGHSKGLEISMLGVVGLSKEIVTVLYSKGQGPRFSEQALEGFFDAT